MMGPLVTPQTQLNANTGLGSIPLNEGYCRGAMNKKDVSLFVVDVVY